MIRQGETRPIDAAFSELMRRYSPDMSAAAQDLIVELSQALSLQHSCLDLSRRRKTLVKELSGLSIVGDGQVPTPLVLRDDQLYLHRYFQYESSVARALIRRNRALPPQDHLGDQLEKYFGSAGGTINWQQIAALQSQTQQLTIITGGPGTGKTSTVAKILSMLRENDTDMDIKLAAPTGKAAMRLAESIVQFLPNLPEDSRETIPTRVQTLHRLLGMRSNGRSFRYNRDNLISADVLIVDEVSMIDLTMMHRLLEALPADTRLLLLGDPDQLPSVEAGNVLADLCRDRPGFSPAFADLCSKLLSVDVHTRKKQHALTDTICHFETNYRFSMDQGIGQLAVNIQAGELTLLSSSDDEVSVYSLESLAQDRMRSEIASYYFEYEMLLQDPLSDAASLLSNFESTRILCPTRDGDLGVETLNREMETHLEAQGLKASEQSFYHGRPIIITQNDYNLGLFNGDIGICVNDAQDNQIKAAFMGPLGEIKLYLASRLPPHETCFAMTVHKSQGSEFSHVTLILPNPTSTLSEQLLTRELIYTAVTRARHSMAIYANEITWSAALQRSVRRMSGLSSMLEVGEVTEELTDTQIDLFS